MWMRWIGIFGVFMSGMVLLMWNLVRMSGCFVICGNFEFVYVCVYFVIGEFMFVNLFLCFCVVVFIYDD